MNIQAQYESEMGIKATYRKGASDYHTLEYVRWLEHYLMRVREALAIRRDAKIRELWLVYRDMSDIMQSDEWDAADLELWGLVTEHAAVQSQLRRKPERERTTE